MAQQIAFLNMMTRSATVARYNGRVEQALKDSRIPHTRVACRAGIKIFVDDANIEAAAKVVLSVSNRIPKRLYESSY